MPAVSAFSISISLDHNCSGIIKQDMLGNTAEIPECLLKTGAQRIGTLIARKSKPN
jgi:hypothetical protein